MPFGRTHETFKFPTVGWIDLVSLALVEKPSLFCLVLQPIFSSLSLALLFLSCSICLLWYSLGTYLFLIKVFISYNVATGVSLNVSLYFFSWSHQIRAWYLNSRVSTLTFSTSLYWQHANTCFVFISHFRCIRITPSFETGNLILQNL